MALQGERGDKPRWLSHKRAAAIHDSSPKANAEPRKRAGADVPVAIPQLVVTIPSKQAGVRGVVQAAASP